MAWHNKHIGTQWGVAIVGFMLVSVALLIPVLGQNQDNRSHAMYTPIAQNQTYGTCSPGGHKGVCQDANKDSCAGGYYQSGYCPGTSNIKCCVKGVYCTVNKVNGTCQNTSNPCNGAYVSGYCPGSSDVKCCVPNTSSLSPYVITNSFCKVDARLAPDLINVAQNIANICTKLPAIYSLLTTDALSVQIHPVITLTNTGFKDSSGKENTTSPAWTTMPNVFLRIDYLRAHPDDMGMVVHEFGHVAQGYYSTPTWLTESGAEYVRYELGYQVSWTHYGCSLGITYKTGGGCGATLLKYVRDNYADKSIVKEVTMAMRNNTYADSIFETKTGKKLVTLWNECLIKGYCSDHSQYYH